MTEKEALEKLRKDIHDLADQKQLLVLQVHELTVGKRVQEDRLQKARKEAAEVEIENADRVNKCLLKAQGILAGAAVKESESITKMQSLAKWEQELARKEQEQLELSFSIDNRLVELADERKKFGEEAGRVAREKYTSEVCAKKMLEVYKEAILTFNVGSAQH